MVVMDLRGDCSSILNSLNPKVAEMLIKMLLEKFPPFSFEALWNTDWDTSCFLGTQLSLGSNLDGWIRP